MTITTISTISARWIFKGVEKIVSWVRMSFNASKFRSLVLKKDSKERFKLSSETIPTIREKPINSLRKRIDRSLRYTIAIQDTKDYLEKWLTKVDKSGLPGRFKAWIYQHAILPKVLWPLSIYEFTMNHIEQMEVCSRRKKKVSRELQVAVERLHEKATLGTVAKGRAGLGFFSD